MRFLRWFSTPLYGALFGWAVPWARRLLLWSAGCVGVGAAGGLAIRGLLK